MTLTSIPAAVPARSDIAIRRIWAELTGNCQLACIHCYADSGPSGSHGKMTADHWMSVVDDANKIGAHLIQFIGGEPTMHPQFPSILQHAVDSGIAVEVYSNLVHVTDEVWELLTAPNVSLAFSYYSKDARRHNAVTARNSHSMTRRNAIRAVNLGIPIRAGIIDTGDGLVDDAKQDLQALGIIKIAVDRVRAIGRGGGNDISELCGRCGKGVAAINPDGDVWPCIFARWITVGNVMTSPLADILSGPAMAHAAMSIPNGRQNGCDPDDDDCTPGSPPSSCSPRT
jgi:MoaA/NifB/PqqE/SkfB family radical SAM enzyme